MPKDTKATAAEVDYRIGVLIPLILKGFSTREMMRQVAANPQHKWDVNRRQFENYIKKARAEIAESSADDREAKISLAAAQYNFLYRRLVAQKDYKGAIAPLDRLVALFGLNPTPEKDDERGFEIIIRNESDRAKVERIETSDPAENWNH